MPCNFSLLIGADPLFTNRPVQLATLAARHAMPTIYAVREFAEAGGLMSYGSSYADLFRHAGTYTGRVLKGEKPADLPILLPRAILRWSNSFRIDYNTNRPHSSLNGLRPTEFAARPDQGHNRNRLSL